MSTPSSKTAQDVEKLDQNKQDGNLLNSEEYSLKSVGLKNVINPEQLISIDDQKVLSQENRNQSFECTDIVQANEQIKRLNS